MSLDARAVGDHQSTTEEVREAIENAMRMDDEITVKQLREQLNSQGTSLSLTSVLRCRKSLGFSCSALLYMHPLM